LPVDKLKLPKGFKIEVYAAGVGNARTVRQGDKGTVFVGSRLLDKVYAIVDKGGKREVKTLYSGLYRPNGLAFKSGTLYIAELSKISKVEKVEDNLDNPPKPVLIYDDLPKDEPHGWKFLTIGPDNKLYFQVGAPCNICMPSPAHAQIRRINSDGSGAEVVARGIRQIVGMDWSPTTKQLYFTENSRDWLSEDIPEDKLNRLAQPGKDNFGYPYCHQGNIPDQEFGWGQLVRRVHQADRIAGPAYSPARHAVLYRQHVPGRISQRDLHHAPRLLEPEQEDRRRHRRGEAQQGRDREVDRAVPHRLHREQQLRRTAGRRGDPQGWLAAGLRRFQRGGLPH
jgi:glucose/arabinose dehydrogenase